MMLNVVKAIGRKLRSSSTVQAEIAQTEKAHAEHEAAVARLAAEYDAALLASDEKVDANEAAASGARRELRRCELRLADLRSELDATKAAEETAAVERKRSEAQAAIDQVRAQFDSHYRTPARKIAAFLKAYAEAETLAAAAGLATLQEQLRSTPSRREPERTETYTAFVNEQGGPTTRGYRTQGYRARDAGGGRMIDDATGKELPRREEGTFTRVVPAQFIPGESLAPLSDAVALPGLATGEDAIWPEAR